MQQEHDNSHENMLFVLQGNERTMEASSFYLSGLMNKILTACYDRNCDNIVYLLQ